MLSHTTYDVRFVPIADMSTSDGGSVQHDTEFNPEEVASGNCLSQRIINPLAHNFRTDWRKLCAFVSAKDKPVIPTSKTACELRTTGVNGVSVINGVLHDFELTRERSK